jgi:RND superfamily putative drug exporter
VFNGLAKTVSKRWYVLLVAWVIVLVFSAPLSSLFFKSVSYQVAISIPGSTSHKAEELVSHFKLSGVSAANGIILIEGNASSYSSFLSNLTSYGNISVTSFYSIEKTLLNSSLSKVYPTALNLTRQLYILGQNETEIEKKLQNQSLKLNSSVQELEKLSNFTRAVEGNFYNAKQELLNTSMLVAGLHKSMMENVTAFNKVMEGELDLNSSVSNLSALLFQAQYYFVKVWISLYDNSTLPTYHNVFLSNYYAFTYVNKSISNPIAREFFQEFFHFWNTTANYVTLSSFPENQSAPFGVADESVHEASYAFFRNNETELALVDAMFKFFNVTNFMSPEPYEEFVTTYFNQTYHVPLEIAEELYTTNRSVPLALVLNFYHEKTGISIPLLLEVYSSTDYLNLSLQVLQSKVNSTQEREFLEDVYNNINVTSFDFAVKYVSNVSNVSPEVVAEVANFTSYTQFLNYVASKEANSTIPAWFLVSLATSHDYGNLTAYLVSSKLGKLSFLLNRSNITPKEISVYLINATWDKASNVSSILISNVVNSTPLITVDKVELKQVLYSMLTTNSSVQKVVNELIAENLFPIQPNLNVTKDLYSSSFYILVLKGNFTYKEAENLESYVKNVTHLSTYLTGSEPISHSLKNLANSAFSIAIPVGIALAIILAGIYFRSITAAFAPLGTYLAAYLASSVVIYAVVIKLLNITVDFLTPSQVLLLALGLGTDYVVFISGRYIEEREKGLSKEEAVKEAVRWGGRAVTITALVVMLSFLFLYVYNVPFFSDTALAEMLAVLVVWIASITLYTSVLSALGDKLFFPRKFTKKNNREESKVSRPGLTVGIITAVVVVLAIYAVSTPLTFNVLDLLPPNQATQGVNILSQQFKTDNVFPIYVVVPINGTFNLSTYNYAVSLYEKLSSIQGVTAVNSPVSPFGSLVPYQNLSEYNYTQYLADGYMLFVVNQKYPPFSNNAFYVVKQVLSAVGKGGYVGGGPVDAYDILNFVNTDFAEIFLLITITMYVILVVMTRSFSVSGVIIFTIMSAVAITLGLERLIFTELGYSIFAIVPLFLVAIIIGIGMDYNIFLVARVHEELDKGKDMEEAVEIARKSIGRTILFLGLIFAGTMGSLMLVNAAILQEIGFALAVAAILETSVLWYFLAPSLLVILYKAFKIRPKMIV